MEYGSKDLRAEDSDCEDDSLSYISSPNLTPIPIKKFKQPLLGDASTVCSDNMPCCRICQLPGDKTEILFSPCRCSGSLKFVHYACLLKWLEILSKKTKKPPQCELCHFLYIRHKRFKLHSWRFPRVSLRDKLLHVTFFFNLLVMVSCAIATALCFLSDKGQVTKFPKNKVELTTEEILTLSCGVMFFVSFFIAMTVEIKAKHTVYKLLRKFIRHNTEWQIEPYNKSSDSYHGPPQMV
ncbi:hypothetical protein LOTGIDRAFT_234708 [Lottia gigantea]|uniref:RING-CH-type domain-containing protein n=1 Tax=Lottia gigantea TaxID=225164 RepID=V3ZUV1_LOTGI|nr:hypothetical protein LOTGIDRAFT_234708 [Lottia gigantea]ESO88147.1 hypothetical protein LOTGIDRAFT_234708 [Lottia gigantea]